MQLGIETMQREHGLACKIEDIRRELELWRQYIPSAWRIIRKHNIPMVNESWSSWRDGFQLPEGSKLKEECHRDLCELFGSDTEMDFDDWSGTGSFIYSIWENGSSVQFTIRLHKDECRVVRETVWDTEPREEIRYKQVGDCSGLEV